MKKEIPEKLYKELTIEDKINILHYERGAQALVRVGHYEDLSENPNKPIYPSWLYISHVLGMDFSKFYESDLAKKSWKYKEEMKKIAYEFPGDSDYKSTHIGDALSDVLFIMLHTDFNYTINEELMETIDQKLKTLYEEFMNLVDKKEYRYEECGELNGETIYKRVEKL